MIPTHNSTFVGDLCCRMASRYRWPTCFASFEQQPTGDHRRSLRTWYAKKLVVSMSPEELDEADAWINQWFCFMVPDEDSQASLAWIMERMAVAAIRYGSKLFVLDPWNEVEHDRPDGMTMTDYIGWALRELKRFARKYQVHVIVVAHPQKMRRDPAGGYPVPTLYDISDSAHWKNRADVGVVINRPDADKDKTLVRVDKSRFHDQIGTPGDIYVRYRWDQGTYEKFEADEQPVEMPYSA